MTARMDDIGIGRPGRRKGSPCQSQTHLTIANLTTMQHVIYVLPKRSNVTCCSRHVQTASYIKPSAQLAKEDGRRIRLQKYVRLVFNINSNSSGNHKRQGENFATQKDSQHVPS